jgi:DNA-binding transcriptional MerR regulator
MTYRVSELAAAAGLSVEVIRSYQSKGLLPPPRHLGRDAFYGEQHLERLNAIRDLRTQGLSLKAVAAYLGGTGPGSGALVAGPTRQERLSLADLADRARVPPALLRSLEASGVLRPLPGDEARPYTASDVDAVRMVLTLIGGGVPMEDFMAVARVQIAAAEEVGRGATELFMRYIRQPLVASGKPRRAEAEELAAAFKQFVRTAAALIAYNIERTLVASVETELDRMGTPAERSAVRRAAEGRIEVA